VVSTLLIHKTWFVQDYGRPSLWSTREFKVGHRIDHLYVDSNKFISIGLKAPFFLTKKSGSQVVVENKHRLRYQNTVRFRQDYLGRVSLSSQRFAIRWMLCFYFQNTIMWESIWKFGEFFPFGESIAKDETTCFFSTRVTKVLSPSPPDSNFSLRKINFSKSKRLLWPEMSYSVSWLWSNSENQRCRILSQI